MKKSLNTGLKTHIHRALKDYFTQLDGHATKDLYAFFMAEVEPPLLSSVMEYVEGNQCRATEILGVSRGTLRKKLKQYKLEKS